MKGADDPGATGRDVLIDALRGLAALAVVLHHLNAIMFFEPGAGLQAWVRLTAYGYLGVPVFFVVSGYCIGLTWSRSPGIADFSRRRFRRIYPAYLASVVLVLLIAVAWKVVTGINDVTILPQSPGHVTATLLLLTEPATMLPTVNWVYWSLTNEVFYYLVLGLLLLAPAGQARGGCLLATHASLLLVELTGRNFRGSALFFVDHWDVFALGICAFLLVQRRPEAKGFVALSGVHLALQAWQGRSGLYQIVGLATVILVILPQAHRFPAACRPFAAVGRISYSLYLVHVPIGAYVFMRLVGPHLDGSTLRLAASQSAGLALVLVAATFFHRWFEQPFLTRRRAPAG